MLGLAFGRSRPHIRRAASRHNSKVAVSSGPTADSPKKTIAITAVAAGTSTITIIAPDDGGIAKVDVTVP